MRVGTRHWSGHQDQQVQSRPGLPKDSQVKDSRGEHTEEDNDLLQFPKRQVGLIFCYNLNSKEHEGQNK